MSKPRATRATIEEIQAMLASDKSWTFDFETGTFEDDDEDEDEPQIEVVPLNDGMSLQDMRVAMGLPPVGYPYITTIQVRQTHKKEVYGRFNPPINIKTIQAPYYFHKYFCHTAPLCPLLCPPITEADFLSLYNAVRSPYQDACAPHLKWFDNEVKQLLLSSLNAIGQVGDDKMAHAENFKQIPQKAIVKHAIAAVIQANGDNSYYPHLDKYHQLIGELMWRCN